MCTSYTTHSQAMSMGCAAARVLEKAIVNATVGIDAVTQVMQELRDPNRISPFPEDEYLASLLGLMMIPTAYNTVI